MTALIKDKYSNERHVMVDDVLLCGGVVSDNSAFPTDVESVLSLKDRQEENWVLCPVCGSKFTGLSEEEFLSKR